MSAGITGIVTVLIKLSERHAIDVLKLTESDSDLVAFGPAFSSPRLLTFSEKGFGTHGIQQLEGEGWLASLGQTLSGVPGQSTWRRVRVKRAFRGGAEPQKMNIANIAATFARYCQVPRHTGAAATQIRSWERASP